MDTEERSAEKNDVDISMLFKWSKEINIQDSVTGDYINLSMRLLGDADLGKARAYAYREAGEYRKLLRKPGSDERTALLVELEEFSDKTLIAKAVVLLRMQNYYQQAVKSVDFPEPREPDTDDSQELWEKYQENVDKYPKRFKEKVIALAEKLKADDEKNLLEKDNDAIYRIYESEVINRLAQERMGSSFYDMCLYLATFTDNKFKHRAFKSFEDFKNTHPKLKEILKEHYQSLELGTDLLKKLPGVTVSP